MSAYLDYKCSASDPDGGECFNWSVEGSPINLCLIHLQEAFEFATGNITQLSPSTYQEYLICKECERGRVYQLKYPPRTTYCDECGAQGSRYEFPLADAAGPTEYRRSGEPVPRDYPHGVVYYIQFGNRVKIGTSINWQSRIRGIPHDTVLAVEPGSYSRESERHQQFSGSRVQRSEWFEVTPELSTHLDELRAAHPDLMEEVEAYNGRKERAGVVY